jgi:hypothetical protein
MLPANVQNPNGVLRRHGGDDFSGVKHKAETSKHAKYDGPVATMNPPLSSSRSPFRWAWKTKTNRNKS